MEVEVEFPEELGDGEGGAYTHYPGSDTGDCGAAEFGEDGLMELEGAGALHEEDGGRCDTKLRHDFMGRWKRTTCLHQ